MQLALTPEVLVPAGTVLLLLALVAVLVVRRRRRRRSAARMSVADGVREAAGPDVPTEDTPAAEVRAAEVRAEDVPADGAAAGRAEPVAADRVGSGRTVAAAVAQALAVREARARVAASSPTEHAGGDDVPAQADLPRPPAPARTDGPGPDVPGPPDGVAWQEPAAASRGRDDARDRLLAVLLDDPVRAVGAAVELEACRRQLDRLTDAVRHERHILASVLARLADAGLAPDQLARLSGLSDEELRRLLPTRVSA